MVPRVLCVAGLAGALQTPSFYREAAKRAGTPAFYGASTDGRVLDEPRPLIIGVAGGTASGKTALTERVVEQLNGEDIVSITQDSFYRDLSDGQLARVADINFDAPAAFDFDHCVDVLARLRRGEAGVRVPTYDFVANARRPARARRRRASRIAVFEGILALWDARLRDQFDIKIFAHADVVIPRGAENAVAIDLLVRGIRERTMERAALGVAALEPRARSAADAFLV
ncbi:hypothetical protein JL721_6467 [Aureococcus anophagefferens]|nr:hypothetical protein JL721_6467 [Aureococcus anophagefferens]